MSRTEPAATPLGDAFHVFDTTLRDGAQREGISYSVADKLAVARHLDALGVGFIEGGWPGALPKDTEFFARAAAGELELQHAALVAFGATRKAGTSAAEDPQVLALLASRAPVVTLVAKSDRRHIERALRTDVAENCAMVADTVAFLRGEGRRVFLDAEHFFDGFAFDPDTALRVLDAAVTAGADVAVLCDTNGGMLPLGVAEVVTEVAARTGFRLGIHCQDDTGCAVANSVAAVQAGATHVQCTANGYGERAGNADLFAVVGNLVTKLGMPGPTGRAPRRADPHLARVGGDRQHRSRHPPGLCRDVSVRPQGGPARECDQGGSGAVQPHEPGGSSATGSGCWSPRWRAGPVSSSRDPSSAWTWPPTPTPCRRWSRPSRSGRPRAGRSRPPTPRWNC